jgi:hypothetical protein
VGSILPVPTISGFFGIVIARYFDDHRLPLRARHADSAAKIRIDTLEPSRATRAVGS